MDGSRFDAWTRRRFGVAVGGAVGSLLGLIGSSSEGAQAKKGNKKRCRKLGENCKLSGKRQCCKKKGLSCQPPLFGSELRCCRRGQESCTSDSQCCSGSCMDDLCQCKTNGMECGGFDGFCCSLNCEGDMSPTCQPA